MTTQAMNPLILLAGLLAIFAANPASADCSDRRAPGMDWSGCKKISKMLGNSDYTGSRFDDAILTLSQIDHSNFKNASLIKANLTRVDARGSRFENADLTKANAYRAVFDEVSLKQSNLTKSEFFRASLRRAEVAGVDWSKSELGRVDFDAATLADVDFSFTNLSRVNFGNARLSKVDFEGAYTYLTRFEGVDLRDTQNLTQAQLDQSCGDANTLVPGGLKPSAVWPCEYD